jgi:glycogen synthase
MCCATVRVHAVLVLVAGGVGRPLMVIVSRLTQQKGLPLMLHGIKVTQRVV